MGLETINDGAAKNDKIKKNYAIDNATRLEWKI